MPDTDAPKEYLKMAEAINSLLPMFEKLPAAIDVLHEKDRELEKKQIYFEARQEALKEMQICQSTKIDELDKRVDRLDKTLTALNKTLSGVKWALTIAGGAIILWVVNSLLSMI